MAHFTQPTRRPIHLFSFAVYVVRCVCSSAIQFVGRWCGRGGKINLFIHVNFSVHQQQLLYNFNSLVIHHNIWYVLSHGSQFIRLSKSVVVFSHSYSVRWHIITICIWGTLAPRKRTHHVERCWTNEKNRGKKSGNPNIPHFPSICVVLSLIDKRNERQICWIRIQNDDFNQMNKNTERTSSFLFFFAFCFRVQNKWSKLYLYFVFFFF